jgi:hypothetical protein
MTPLRLYLKPLVEPANALKSLRDVLQASHQVRGSAGGGFPIERYRDEYVRWVERIENQLRYLTRDPEALTMFQTERYWRIRAVATGDGAVPWSLITAELDLQTDALEELVNDLQRRVDQLESRSGKLCVLDTNALLEYKPLHELPWSELVGSEVRLIVPLRVVEELDAKKYSSRKDLAQRARRLLRQLDETLGTDNAGSVMEGVTIELPIDGGPRRRPADADEEILDTCEEWQQFTSQPVHLLTADIGMKRRALARKLLVVTPGPNYQRVPDGE